MFSKKEVRKGILIDKYFAYISGLPTPRTLIFAYMSGLPSSRTLIFCLYFWFTVFSDVGFTYSHVNASRRSNRMSNL